MIGNGNLSVMNDCAHYKTSKDYELLAELSKKNDIVCFVDYKADQEFILRDVAKTRYTLYKDGQEDFVVAVRGLCYIGSCSKEGFIDQCVKSNLEFIVPNNAV